MFCQLSISRKQKVLTLHVSSYRNFPKVNLIAGLPSLTVIWVARHVRINIVTFN